MKWRGSLFRSFSGPFFKIKEMKIRFKKSTPGIGYCWLAGQEAAVDGKVLTKELAEKFLETDYAEVTEAEEPKNEVQESNNVSTADKPSGSKSAPKGNARS